jgi:hypothetical protein
MSELFPLDKKDVEAVANSRINRVEGNKSTLWSVLAMVAIVVGVIMTRFTFPNAVAIGWGLSILGVIFFFVYMNQLGKKKKAYRRMLLQEWKAEVEKEAEAEK